MDTRARLWAAINNHVVNRGGHPGLKPHETVVGENYAQVQFGVIEEFVQELEELRALKEAMRSGLESRMKNWQSYARTESKNGHYGTAHNAQLQAAELQFVLDEWLK